MYDQRIKAGPPLGRENARYCLWIGSVGTEAVNRLSWECHQLACTNKICGLRNCGWSGRHNVGLLGQNSSVNGNEFSFSKTQSQIMVDLTADPLRIGRFSKGHITSAMGWKWDTRLR